MNDSINLFEERVVHNLLLQEIMSHCALLTKENMLMLARVYYSSQSYCQYIEISNNVKGNLLICRMKDMMAVVP